MATKSAGGAVMDNFGVWTVHSLLPQLPGMPASEASCGQGKGPPTYFPLQDD